MGIIISTVLTQKCSEEPTRMCVETFYKQKCQTVIFSKNNRYFKKKIVKKGQTQLEQSREEKEGQPGPKSIIPK